MVIDRRFILINVFYGAVFILILSIGVSLADTKIGTGVFPNVQTIEGNLIRGKSTRSDVQKLLGIPTGAGGAMLPGFGDNSEIVEPFDVWYYEDIETGKFRSEKGVLVMDMRQQLIVIFFKGDKFHGYFWTSNQYAGEYR